MKEEKRVPKRRFKEFIGDDAWEQRKLGDVVDFLDERRKPLEAGERESGVYPYYGASGIIDYVKDYIFNDELILLSEDGANIIDRNYRVCFLASGKYWVNNHAHIMKARSEYCNGFICEALERLDYTTYNTGTAQPKLNQKTCCNIMLLVPSYAEQLKIFSMLASFDHLITLHQRKYDKLKSLKSAYLSEMFPQEGEKVPKRRFPGFTDAWEQRKLGDIAADTYGGGTPETSINNYWNGNIPWIQSSDLIEGIVSDVLPKKYITKIGLKKSATKLIPENSIAIITRVGVGKLAFMPYYYTTSQDFLSLSNLEIDGWFGTYSIYQKLQQKLNMVQGTSIKGITKNELLDKYINIPITKEEQIKIGKYFKELDYLITLHQRKLEKLKNLKAAYLQEMFV